MNLHYYMKLFVINADDLGFCESTNVAIAEAFRRGVLTSASLMANGAAFDHAISHVVQPNPGLGIGLHVCLTSGRSVLPADRLPLLVDRLGRFRHGFVSLLALTLCRRKAALAQIESEVEAQFARLENSRVRADHVDSHRHVHMIPAIFRIVSDVAQRRWCTAIRISHEPLPKWNDLFHKCLAASVISNLPKKLVLSAFAMTNRRIARSLIAADQVAGVLGSGRMDEAAFRAAVAIAPEGLTEIITHPGIAETIGLPVATKAEHAFLQSVNRRIELSTLIDPTVAELLRTCGIRLLRFSDVRN